MSSPAALAVGLAAGLHAATWGMYKDAVYEGFSWTKYARSVVVALPIALLFQRLFGFDLASAPGLVLLFGVTYTGERALLECWKTFFRGEDQSKYFIPMSFHVGGRVVESPTARWLAGLAYAGAAVAVGIVLHRAQPAISPALPWLVLAGATGGWLSAVGGAWKDAPLEGFSLFKFFRSPAIATGFALLLATLTDRYLVLALASLGYTVAAIETYKKFHAPHAAPGKFAGKTARFPEMYLRRRPFGLLFTTIWILIGLTFGVALAARVSVAMPVEAADGAGGGAGGGR